MSEQVTNAVQPAHPLQQAVQSSPFPWQKLVWTIVATVLPIALQWLGGLLNAPATPNTDQNTNPPT